MFRRPRTLTAWREHPMTYETISMFGLQTSLQRLTQSQTIDPLTPYRVRRENLVPTPRTQLSLNGGWVGRFRFMLW